MIIMYSSRGLAEIVKNPSKITRKYLDIWFTGAGAFGTGLSMLGWPITKSCKPLLIWDQDNGLRVDLSTEEEVMYSSTIFKYLPKNSDYELGIDLKKLLSLRCLVGTIKALWSQSKLLINPQTSYDMAKKMIEEIPLHTPLQKNGVENGLASIVWPRVIAVDYMGEFLFSAWNHGVTDEIKVKRLQIIQERNRNRDWATKSFLAWSEYKNMGMSKQEYVKEFGYSSRNEYELTSPRDYEILGVQKPSIGELPIENMSIKNLEDLVTGIQYLRSEAKRRNLIWMAALRELVPGAGVEPLPAQAGA